MKHRSLVVLGSEQAGKTCFIAGLSLLSEADRASGFSLCTSDETRAYLHELTKALRSQTWPASTSRDAQHEFEGNLTYRGRDLTVTMFDYAGESFRETYAQGIHLPEAVERQVMEADYILLALDPLVDAGGGDSQYASVHRQQYIERLNSLMEAVHDLRSKRGKRRPFKVAALITKADLITEQPSTPEQAEEYLKTHQPEFYKTLKECFPDLPVFAVSAVGNTQEKEEGRRMPAPSLEPWGYEHVFDWILRDIRWRSWRPRLYAAAAIALVALAAGAVYWAWSDLEDRQLMEEFRTLERRGIHDQNRYEAEQVARALSSRRYEDLVDRVLADSRADREDDGLSRSDAQANLHLLRVFIDTPRHYRSADLQDAYGTWRSYLEERAFQLVEYRRRDDPDNFLAEALNFLERYPNSDKRSEVEAMIEDVHEDQRIRDASNIYSMAVNSTAALESKSEAILNFLENYPNVENASEIRAAVDLSRRLIQQVREETLEIELVGVGRLPEDERAYLALEIHVVGQNETIAPSESGEPVQAHTFENEKEHRLLWTPGDDIVVDLEMNKGWAARPRFWRGDFARVASKRLSSPLAVAELHDGIRLDKVDDDADSFLGEGPVLQANIVGWSSDEWRTLWDWVAPGVRWTEF